MAEGNELEAGGAGGNEGLDASIARLRDEAAQAVEPRRRARILHEISELEEQLGDLVAASRDNLAAFQADDSFLEPLEGLLRLTERRKTLANVGKLLEALVRAARSPDERVRALVLRAVDLDAQGDVEGARGALLEATELDAAPGELAIAWLSLEIVAAKLNDAALREQALAARAERTHHPSWRGLLLIDVARLAAEGGDLDRALVTCERALEIEGPTCFAAAVELERLARTGDAGASDGEGERRARLIVLALQAQARMVERALARSDAGDALGVPRWRRHLGQQIDLHLQIAAAQRAAGNEEAALAALEQALALADTTPSETSGAKARPLAAPAGEEDALALALLRHRLRLGDAAGGSRGIELAERELQRSRAGVLAAGLGVRVAAAASSPQARDAALAEVAAADPDSVLAEGMRRAAIERDAEGLCTYLEVLASRLQSAEAKNRQLVYAAYLAAYRLRDPRRARTLLDRAPLDATTRSAISRAFASVEGDQVAVERAIEELLPHVPAGSARRLGLEVELLRAALQRGQATTALARLRADAVGLPLARLLEAFLPPTLTKGDGADPRQRALEELAVEGLGSGNDDNVRTTFSVLGALEAWSAGLHDDARAAVDALGSERPSDVFLAALRVAMRPNEENAAVALEVAEHLEDPAVAAAFAVQGGLGLWHAGKREQARKTFDEALQSVRTAGDGAASGEATLAALLAWSSRSVPADAEGARSEAVQNTENALSDADTSALERLAAGFVEAPLAGGRTSSPSRLVEEALDQLAASDDLALKRAGALARLSFHVELPDVTTPEGERADAAVLRALETLHEAGALARRASAAERVRRATALAAQAPSFGEHAPTSSRGSSLDANATPGSSRVHAAREWFGEGGGFPAALAWVVAARARRDQSVAKEDVERAALEERRALHAAAQAAPAEDARDMLRLEAALVLAPGVEATRMPLLDSERKEARLANLELAPPGCDPRRRAAVLSSVGDAVGEAAELDACSLAGWSALAAGDNPLALDLFRYVTQTRQDDLAAWEGQRTAAAANGDREALAVAAEALGARLADAERAAQFWEEAGHAWISCGSGYEERGEAALLASFERAPERASAFDALFRRLRDRKAHDQVLELTQKRLANLSADTSRPEAAKLHWERARALREQGNVEAAMGELTTVRELDPEHVGALALAGEVYIREGRFDAAADTLAQLAALATAPAKSRATAAVTAVDLYENKLGRFDRALDVLDNLYRAGLSTPPIRERLARTAVRAESFVKASEILEVLMQERETPAARADAARVAMRIHRDHRKAPRGAEMATARLLLEQPTDGEAIDLLLATEFSPEVRQRLFSASRVALLQQLQGQGALLTSSPDATADALRLAQLAARLGNPTEQQAAVSVAAALGDAASKDSLAQLAARKPKHPKVALPASALARFRDAADAGPLRELFLLLGPTLVDALGPNLTALQVVKKDKVDPRAGLALRSEIIAWAGAFGLAELDLYVGGRDPNGIQGVGGEHPALVVGSQINAPLTTAQRGRVARELYAIATGTTVVRARDELSVASVVVAACKLAKAPIHSPEYAPLAEVERQLSKAIARKTKNMLPDTCQAIARENPDPLAWIAAVRTTHARVALIASGDLPSVLDDLSAEHRSETLLAELVRFSLSPAYAELRALLGLEGGA